jgi:alcohol dehydrogenase/propanol-preferring alcohol dehydrogenase
MKLTDRGVTLPLAMGHEIVGRVVKLGPDAHNQGSKVGDLRVVFPWVGCGTCEACQRDEENMCVTGRALGVFQHGGYATHVLATRWSHLVDIEGVDPSLAATYACSGITVYSAINKLLPMSPDEPIVLVGAGGLGLQAISILKALGHRNIISVDVGQDKLDAATAQGATAVVLASAEGTTQRIIAAAGGPVAGIIDLVNGTQTSRFAFDALRKGAKLVQVGLFGGEMTIPLPLMPIRALTVQGSYVGNVKELRELMGIARSGKIASIPVANEPLRNADAVLNRLKNGKITGQREHFDFGTWAHQLAPIVPRSLLNFAEPVLVRVIGLFT